MQRLTDAHRKYNDGWDALPQESPGAARSADVLGGAPSSAVERALAAMREPLDRPLPLAALAELAGLSPFHFARTFRRATGSPPGQFLAALRLERAKHLLLTTDLPVTEICFAVGYDSVGTFTTRFTQLVGLPPGRVRRLPDLLAEAVARLPGGALVSPTLGAASTTSGVSGRVGPSAGGDPLIFVGLFPDAIPQCRPVAGTMLIAPGPFHLPVPPDGHYHLLAAALPHPRDPEACLLPGAALRVGRAAGTVLAHAGRVSGHTDIILRPSVPTDPPVLVVLPALLLDSCPQFQARRSAAN